MSAFLGELTMLWGVSIIFMALFGTTSEDLLTLERFLKLSTDQLLKGYFQGDTGKMSSE